MAKAKSIGGILHDQTQPLKPIRFDKVVVYSLFGALDDTCGSLVDKLTSICFAGPDFLRPETCRCYLHLLPNFKKPSTKLFPKFMTQAMLCANPMTI